MEPENGYNPTATFTVSQIPRPQPRERSRVVIPKELSDLADEHGITARPFVTFYLPKESPIWDWKTAIADEWRRVMPTAGFRFRGPLVVLSRFIMPRPANLVWKKKPMPRQLDERQAARDSGDVDNLAKAVYDALNQAAWHDDYEIAWAWQERWIAAGDEQPRLDLFIGELDLAAPSLWSQLVELCRARCQPAGLLQESKA